MSMTEKKMDVPAQPINIDAIIGHNVRSAREKRQMSLADFCQLVGMKKGAFHKLETGITRWRVELLIQCAHVLGVSFLDLLPDAIAQQHQITVNSGETTASEPAIMQIAQRLASISEHNLKAIEQLLAHFEKHDT